jgi:hypothetical protein
VRRAFGFILAVVLLVGAAFTAEAWGSRTPAGKASAAPLGHFSAFVTNLQMNGLPLPEPATIVLSSLVLLGSTTLLRRHRSNRRA